jgi:hypothetical protein
MKPTKNLSRLPAIPIDRLLALIRCLLLTDHQRPLIACMHRRIHLPIQHGLARVVEHLQRPDPATFRIIAHLDSDHAAASAFHDGFAGNEIPVREVVASWSCSAVVVCIQTAGFTDCLGRSRLLWFWPED